MFLLNELTFDPVGAINIFWASFIAALFAAFFATLLYNWLEGNIERCRIKNSTIAHLEHIQKLIPDIINEVDVCISKIKNKDDKGGDKMGYYTTFNSEIYRANNPSMYYKIFQSNKNEKFLKVVDIYATIDNAKARLPIFMYEEYIFKINDHLDKYGHKNSSYNEKMYSTREEHFQKCQAIQSIRNQYIGNFELLKACLEDISGDIEVVCN